MVFIFTMVMLNTIGILFAGQPKNTKGKFFLLATCISTLVGINLICGVIPMTYAVYFVAWELFTLIRSFIRLLGEEINKHKKSNVVITRSIFLSLIVWGIFILATLIKGGMLTSIFLDKASFFGVS